MFDGHALVTVEAPDRVGLLWAIASWFETGGYNVVAARLSDDGKGRASDTFLVDRAPDVDQLLARLAGGRRRRRRCSRTPAPRPSALQSERDPMPRTRSQPVSDRNAGERAESAGRRVLPAGAGLPIQVDALRMAVDVVGAAAHEAGDGDTEALSRLDRQAGRSRDGGDERDARPPPPSARSRS